MNLPIPLSRMRQFAPLALVLLSAAAAVAAYLQALDAPFFSDDTTYITENTKLAGLHLAELWRLFTEPYNDMSEFLPLRELSYWLDMTLFGLTPSAFRLHNIILYLLCLPLIYATTLELWRYFRPADAASAPWAAAAVTAMFALHPALVEPVVWISGRKYVLPNLFSMLALWLALRARREQELSAPHAAAALIAFVAVMLSKATYVGMAPIIALLWVIFWLDIPASKRRRAQLLWPLAILFIAGLMIWIFIASSKVADSAFFGIDAIIRVLAVLGWLVRLSISPESRHFFYPIFEDPYLPAMVAMGVAALAAATVGGVMLLRKRSLEGFALAVFLLLCAPYMQLVPYGAPSLVQDRFLALAVWPAVLLLIALSWRLKPAPRSILLLAIALSLGFQTIERPRDWRSSEVLIDTDLRAYPGYYAPALQKIMHFQLDHGLYRDAGVTASNIKDSEARNIMIGLVLADHAVRVKAAPAGSPEEAVKLLQNLESVLKRSSVRPRRDTAMTFFLLISKRMLANQWVYLARLYPGDVLVRYYTGLWLVNTYQYEEAVVYLRVAVNSQNLPESLCGPALKNLGLVSLKRGRLAEAEEALLAALEQPQPDNEAYCLLSKVYKQTRRFEDEARAKVECSKQAPK